MYSASAYFFGKTPLQLTIDVIFFPVLFTSSTYYIIGLNISRLDRFLLANLICILAAWYASSFGILFASLSGEDQGKARKVIMPILLLVLFMLSGNLIPI